MIRKATVEDVPMIARLGEKFHEEAGWGDIAEYVPGDCEATLSNMVANENAILLVAEDGDEVVGMAGAMTFPLYFNASHCSAQELFWYMKPGSRNGVGARLLKALENEAMAKGCASMIMMTLDRIQPEATGHLYARHGYRASEHSWIRRL